MNIATLCAILLAQGCVLASWRLYRAQRGVRLAGLLVLQCAAAFLLYCTLFPPLETRPVRPLVVLTGGLTSEKLSELAQREQLVALPEANAPPGAARAADLASALRQNPGIGTLQIYGAGLSARDWDAARGLSVHFFPAPLPIGVVELYAPSRVRAGAQWQVSGRVHGAENALVELRNPDASIASGAKLDRGGRFTLYGQARVPGRLSFQLQLRAAGGKVLETLQLPLEVASGAKLRVRVLAGGPNPELKYLRRWALDAGMQLQSEISVGAGLRLRDPAPALTPASLAQLDLLVLDERSWRALGAGGRAMLHAALADGLGVLLKITGSLNDAERAELQALGFTVSTAQIVQSVKLPHAELAQLPLNRRPLQVSGSDLVPLLLTEQQQPLAAWRAQQQGRIALWWLDDSFQLVLRGAREHHEQLWSETFGTLARARGQAHLPSGHAWVDERVVLCGVPKPTQVISADGARTEILPDPKTAACAGYWPSVPGWHAVADSVDAFYVRARGEAPALQAGVRASETRKLSLQRAVETDSAEQAVPGQAWHYFLGWLAVSGLLWWLERKPRARSSFHSAQLATIGPGQNS